MTVLPPALSAMAAYTQFIIWTTVDRGGKVIKLPVDYRTGTLCAKGSGVTDPAIYTTAQNACDIAALLGPNYGVGFVFTENDPFFFVDIDKCLNPDGATWSDISVQLYNLLPGAAIEISQSGKGLHIIGSGICPAHACKNIPLGLELYTENRFVALTGISAQGDAGKDFSAVLPYMVDTYYPAKASAEGAEWTFEPSESWTGPEDNEELIKKAKATRSAASIWSTRCSFADLWDKNEEALAVAYPDADRVFDESSADAALAQHLAFWTGKHCERIRELMQQSGLVRDKYEREDYLERTVLKACAMQEDVYSVGAADNTLADQYGAPKLKASSEAQRTYAESVRADKLAQATEEQRVKLCQVTGANAGAKFWLENQEKNAQELTDMVTAVESTSSPLSVRASEMRSGYQYLAADKQLEYFKGCVYVQSAHKIFTPKGTLLKADQFNATYGGYVFQLDETGDKTTRKAWEAFTESQALHHPKAEGTCFRPELPTGSLVEEEGHVMVNTYVPIITARMEGDPQPFLTHLMKLLPEDGDREILLAYMAAVVQYKGVKFQWAPLVQGVEGNGKTLLARCLAFAVGNKYTHLPPAHEIGEKFNDWLFHKLFIGVEEVLVPESKREVMEILKPMITNDRLAMRAMQQSQVMGDNRANFLFTSNYKDAIRKSRNDRRFAVFYTAQQEAADLTVQEMDGEYFSNLYQWLNDGGYAIVNDFLATYEIPAALNPATNCQRAPRTTSFEEAVHNSMGTVEQTILEAVEEGRMGFMNGWISSVHLDNLLQDMRMARAVPANKRRDLMRSLGYDWHPALRNGRTNNIIAIDDGKKPRLFIRDMHPANNEELTGAEVSRLYQNAQSGAALEEVAAIFGQA